MQRHVLQLEKVIKELQQTKEQLKLQNILQKEILDISEASLYLNISESTLYKLTAASEIIHFKPNGKKIWIRRKDCDNYVLSKPNSLNEEELEKARENVRELLKTINK